MSHIRIGLNQYCHNNMELYIIETGYFKLDGGAMFGVVPQQMWKKLNPPDSNNMCTWSMRCLLVKEGNRLILFDTGMGDKQDDKFRSHFEPHGESTLLGSIRAHGFSPEEVTDVVFTHLHFDHCGGGLYRNNSGDIAPVFPQATYWTSKSHFDWATNPNSREKASFLKENILPLKEHNLIKFVDEGQGVGFTEAISFDFYYGHTEAMMVPTIKMDNGKKLLYPADLLPSSGHVKMPYVMAYDIRPLTTLKEKAMFYEKVLGDDVYLMFEHDPIHALGKLGKNDRGRYTIIDQSDAIPDIFVL